MHHGRKLGQQAENRERAGKDIVFETSKSVSSDKHSPARGLYTANLGLQPYIVERARQPLPVYESTDPHMGLHAGYLTISKGHTSQLHHFGDRV